MRQESSYMNKRDVAAMIDHTILKPEATQADVARIVEEGAAAGTFSVCVSPSMLPLDVPEGLKVACVVGFPSGADFVKTSTGFHPAGGASTHAVALMRATVGDALGVKASGGIRDAETALAMIEAGASRLGVSATTAILAGLED